MPNFKFIVTDGKGRQRRGRIAHESLEEARAQLEERGLAVEALVPQVSRRSWSGDSPPSTRKLSEVLRTVVTPTRLAYLAVAFFGLSILVTAARTGDGSRQPDAAAVRPRVIRVRGKIEGYRDDMKALLKLPEIPLTIDIGALSRDGELNWEQKLLLPQSLTEAEFEVILTEEENLTLLSRQMKIPENGKVELGSLSIEKVGRP